MNVMLDTNVLVRMTDPDDAHFASTVDAIRRLDDSACNLVIVPQVLYEFWGVATRPLENNGLGLNPNEAHSEIQGILELYRLLRDERAIFPIWEQLVTRYDVKGKPAHDARLVAAMIRHSITHLLTYNTSDFKRYSEITALSPMSVLDGADLI